MKNQKLINRILVAVLAVCLLVAGVSWFATRATEREATRQEQELYRPYVVLWDQMPGESENESCVDRILALCQRQEDVTLGTNQYASYASQELGQYLYNCAAVEYVLISGEGMLLIAYNDGPDPATARSVVLTYDAEGLREQSVYDPEPDILFYESEETTLVYENASNMRG